MPVEFELIRNLFTCIFFFAEEKRKNGNSSALQNLLETAAVRFFQSIHAGCASRGVENVDYGWLRMCSREGVGSGGWGGETNCLCLTGEEGRAGGYSGARSVAEPLQGFGVLH